MLHSGGHVGGVRRTITYASDYFAGMIDIAKKMITAGHMYADNTDVDTMRAERMACTPSQHRDQKPAETLRIFEEEMLLGTPVRRQCGGCGIFT